MKRLPAALVGTLALASSFVAFAPASGAATSWFAYPNGTSASTTSCPFTSTTSNQCSLGRSLLNAVSGDTIELEAGDYSTVASNGSMPFDVGTSVTVEADPANVAPVYLDGANTTSVVTVASGVTTTISGVTIENGFVSSTGSVGAGVNNSGTLTLIDDTIAHNSGAFGAGIRNAGVVTVTHSTVAANDASANGGGLYSSGSTSTFTVLASTFAYNANGGPYAPYGADIALASSGAGTVSGDVFGDSCGSAPGTAWTDGGYNAGIDISCVYTGGPDDSTALTAGELGLLADNGGLTETIGLVAGNPAIGLIPQDTSVDTWLLCPTLDERGVPTPLSGACDAGAVQLEITAPTAPNLAPPVPGNDQATLSWEVTADGGSSLTGFDIFEGAATGGEGANPVAVAPANVAEGQTETFTVGGLANGTRYYFTVEAVNSVAPSPASVEYSVTPGTVPSAPSGLIVSPTGTTSISLVWSAPTNDGGWAVSGYDVLRSTSPSGPFVSVGGPVVDELIDTGGLKPSTTYYYKVAAENGLGMGVASPVTSATTQALVSTPQALTVSGVEPPATFAGEKVSVYGLGFTRSTLIFFGNRVASSITYVTPTHMAVVVPPGHSGAVVSITARNGSTTSASPYELAVRFNYLPGVATLAPHPHGTIGEDGAAVTFSCAVKTSCHFRAFLRDQRVAVASRWINIRKGHRARVRLLWTSQGKIDLAIGITRAEIRRSAVVRIENVR